MTYIKRKEFLTDEIADAIRAHAMEAYPHESLGAITPRGYERMPNLSPEPEKEGVFPADVMDSLQASGDLLGIVHSHPGGYNCPSKADMELQIALGIPSIMAYVNGDGTTAAGVSPLTMWGDCLEPLPLIGRGYQCGVTDCLEVGRDWYLEQVGLRPPPVAHQFGWWKKSEGGGLFLDLFSQMGFVEIDKSDFREGDVGLAALRTGATLSHALINVGNDLLLHHNGIGKPYSPERLSARTPMYSWLHHIQKCLRPHADYQTLWSAR